MRKKGKYLSSVLALALSVTMVADFAPAAVSKAAFDGTLSSVDSVTAVNGKNNVVEVSYNGGAVKGRITFLEDGIFRFNVDPSGQFDEYAVPNSSEHKATIQAQSDDSDKYSKPTPSVKEADGNFEISVEDGATIVLDKDTALMSIKNAAGVTVMEESNPLSISGTTAQYLKTDENEYFFGGGTQNGRFTHKGKAINIVNESVWTDGGVSSPNPFYWSSDGYGVLRNTFKPGRYDFGAADEQTVTTVHNENEFDAYYFVDNEIKAEEASAASAVAASLGEVQPTADKSMPYTDVTSSDWFSNYVYDVYVKKLMTGLDKTTFGPNGILARAQFAIILYRMNDEPKVSYSERFSDIYSGDWYMKAVLWAASDDAKIVTGYSDGRFGPNDNITREQMALMMYRYAKYKGYDRSNKKSLDSFPDAGLVSSYAKDAMEWCVAEGIISGQGASGEQKKLNPGGNTTRAECAAIISRFTNSYESDNPDNPVEPDNPDNPTKPEKGYSVTDTTENLLNEYYAVTGNPVLLPEYAYYVGHLNAYNRDGWQESTTGSGWTLEDGKKYNELGQAAGYKVPAGTYAESLNNEAPTVLADNFKGVINDDSYKFSARAVIDGYVDNDMPLGWFLPNDGYGSGYGKNGYFQTRTAQEKASGDYSRMKQALDANLENLADFTEYAESNGVRSGLWTQSALTMEASEDDTLGFHVVRDFAREVLEGGVSALKTDVAWVGSGYSMALNAQKDGYNYAAAAEKRPAVISVDGWAGTQRYAGIWTGDQTGGNWEYIRFHIPTYIGQSLSGNPNCGSDVDGIFGGNELIMTRDLQFKTFSQVMMDMDGWGYIPKKPHISADPYKSINRMYLKLKAQLLPYIYTEARNAVDGLPMIRAMFLEEENPYTYSTAVQYQYMFGDNFLVAPVYQDTQADEVGNDVRNNIYLPTTSDIWIDYFTGDQYAGGQVVSNFDAPVWKLPLFVKNGAIIPMYEDNNNPMAPTEDNEKGLDRTRRIVEFYPSGNTSYTLKEDDGISMTLGEDGTPDYGSNVTTEITSKVSGTKATLTVDASKGSYEGYDSDRHTTFVVNVSAEPSKLTAKNGSTTVNLAEASSYEDFQTKAAADQAVYYYDAQPNLNKYAKDDEAFKNTKITTTPKLYVSFPRTDVSKNAQTLVVEGFENKGSVGKSGLNAKLAAPKNLAAPEEQKTPTSILLTWDAVEGAAGYELKVDGDDFIYAVGNATQFNHVDLGYGSTHTYQVRARNEEGYSEWSEEITSDVGLDPWRNVPKATITWKGGDDWGALANATDHDIATMFHSTGDVVSNEEPFIMDFGYAYQLDKFEYYPRDNFNNGTVSQMDIYVSLDGMNWKLVHAGADDVWSYNNGASVADNVKTVSLDGETARYVKLIVKASVGNFFSANELVVYKKDGTSGFAVGSTNNNEQVSNNDYTNMKNYLGITEKDTGFDAQIKARGGDINMNGIYEAYDYAYTMFKLDGGTKQSGMISGSASADIPDSAAANEEFTITISTENVKNMNAIGALINFDPDKIEYKSIKASGLGEMEDLSIVKSYDDGSAYLNVAYANRGDKALYSGSENVITITMKAKQAVTLSDKDVINVDSITLIGPDFSYIK